VYRRPGLWVFPQIFFHILYRISLDLNKIFLDLLPYPIPYLSGPQQDLFGSSSISCTGSLWNSKRSYQNILRILRFLPDLSGPQRDLSGSSSVSYQISLDLNEIFPDLLRTLPDISGPQRDLSGSSSVSYRISLDLNEIFPDLTRSFRTYPISPVLAESLLISPDLCKPYLIFGSRISPESFRIFLDISGFLQIFQVPLMTEHGVKRA
jgi:hypothetical protein